MPYSLILLLSHISNHFLSDEFLFLNTFKFLPSNAKAKTSKLFFFFFSIAFSLLNYLYQLSSVSYHFPHSPSNLVSSLIFLLNQVLLKNITNLMTVEFSEFSLLSFLDSEQLMKLAPPSSLKYTTF